MPSQRKGVHKKTAKKPNTKLVCRVGKSKQQQQVLKKADRLLAKAITADKNALRTKRAPQAHRKQKQQEGKGLFSVLIPLIATAIGSAVASR